MESRPTTAVGPRASVWDVGDVGDRQECLSSNGPARRPGRLPALPACDGREDGIASRRGGTEGAATVPGLEPRPTDGGDRRGRLSYPTGTAAASHLARADGMWGMSGLESRPTTAAGPRARMGSGFCETGVSRARTVARRARATLSVVPHRSSASNDSHPRGPWSTPAVASVVPGARATAATTEPPLTSPAGGTPRAPRRTATACHRGGRCRSPQLRDSAPAQLRAR